MTDIRREDDTVLVEQQQTGVPDNYDNPVPASVQWGLHVGTHGNDLYIGEGYTILTDGYRHYHALTTHRPFGDLTLPAGDHATLRLVIDPGTPNGVAFHTASRPLPKPEAEYDPERPWVIVAEFDRTDDGWTAARRPTSASSDLEDAALPLAEDRAQEYVTPDDAPERLGGGKIHGVFSTR